MCSISATPPPRAVELTFHSGAAGEQPRGRRRRTPRRRSTRSGGSSDARRSSGDRRRPATSTRPVTRARAGRGSSIAPPTRMSTPGAARRAAASASSMRRIRHARRRVVVLGDDALWTSSTARRTRGRAAPPCADALLEVGNVLDHDPDRVGWARDWPVVHRGSPRVSPPSLAAPAAVRQGPRSPARASGPSARRTRSAPVAGLLEPRRRRGPRGSTWCPRGRARPGRRPAARLRALARSPARHRVEVDPHREVEPAARAVAEQPDALDDAAPAASGGPRRRSRRSTSGSRSAAAPVGGSGAGARDQRLDRSGQSCCSHSPASGPHVGA